VLEFKKSIQDFPGLSRTLRRRGNSVYNGKMCHVKGIIVTTTLCHVAVTTGAFIP